MGVSLSQFDSHESLREHDLIKKDQVPLQLRHAGCRERCDAQALLEQQLTGHEVLVCFVISASSGAFSVHSCFLVVLSVWEQIIMEHI